jgi:hypothetical protein
LVISTGDRRVGGRNSSVGSGEMKKGRPNWIRPFFHLRMINFKEI